MQLIGWAETYAPSTPCCAAIATTTAPRIILGHHSTVISEIYAEKDEQESIKAMMKAG
jgi:hypothetical protein